MKRIRLASAVVVAAATWAFGDGGGARADSSRVSLEVGGIVSSVDVEGGVPELPAGTRAINVVNGSNGAGDHFVRDSIVGVEMRPTFNIVGGLRLGVGFRAGSAPSSGDRSDTTLVGGDVSAGYHRKIGKLMPFAEVRFGFNQYEFHTPIGGQYATDQLRLDAVLGSRVYLTPGVFLSASAFAGFGDRYGGTVAMGIDVVRYKMRGNLP